jgi:hypothetical protein
MCVLMREVCVAAASLLCHFAHTIQPDRQWCISYCHIRSDPPRALSVRAAYLLLVLWLVPGARAHIWRHTILLAET